MATQPTSANPTTLRGADLPSHQLCHGMIYPDRWCSPYLSVSFPELRGAIAVELEIWNPEFPEFEKNEFVVRANHRLIHAERKLMPGDLKVIKLELDAAPVAGRPFNFSFRSAANFSPKLPDTRLLAVIVRKFAIKSL